MFIGAALPQSRLQVPDKRLLAGEYGGDVIAQPPLIIAIDRTNTSVDPIAGFATPWWPAPSAMLGDSGMGDMLWSVFFQNAYPTSGASGRLALAGVTRDQYGSPLGGVTVRAFRTSTTELVSTVVSDANGYFAATTPYDDAHFITTHKSGPPVAGASVDTLIPG